MKKAKLIRKVLRSILLLLAVFAISVTLIFLSSRIEHSTNVPPCELDCGFAPPFDLTVYNYGFPIILREVTLIQEIELNNEKGPSTSSTYYNENNIIIMFFIASLFVGSSILLYKFYYSRHKKHKDG